MQTNTDGYYVQEIDADLSSRGYGEIGEYCILDQGNDVPDEIRGSGPWPTRAAAQRELDWLNKSDAEQSGA